MDSRKINISNMRFVLRSLRRRTPFWPKRLIRAPTASGYIHPTAVDKRSTTNTTPSDLLRRRYQGICFERIFLTIFCIPQNVYSY